uniref:Uncharacterized protein n=1 Tax=Arundo donax TaxID=35708 RepID=A0A0A8ZHY9_ARUDO
MTGRHGSQLVGRCSDTAHGWQGGAVRSPILWPISSTTLVIRLQILRTCIPPSARLAATPPHGPGVWRRRTTTSRTRHEDLPRR